MIAATLANGGTSPITGNSVLKPEAVRDVLSLLHSCGFYESSGYFAFKLGIPGKTSVTGSMMMVLPSTLGNIFLLAKSSNTDFLLDENLHLIG